MGRYLGPVCKLCRREGEQLFLKGNRCISDKCALKKRKSPPGASGSRRGRQLSEYGKQLREKQKIKRWYNLLEKQFKLSFKEADRKKGKTGENLLIDLEMRLDSIVYIANLAISRPQARQIIKHRHVKVNGKIVNIPSYAVNVGDEIEIKDKFKKNRVVLEALKVASSVAVPKWMELDADNAKVKIISAPERSDIKVPADEQLVVELYSK